MGYFDQGQNAPPPGVNSRLELGDQEGKDLVHHRTTLREEALILLLP
jgi:hypothetical protein